MNFFEAFASCMNKYVGFSGRASRSEYWFFRLAYFIISMITRMIDKTALQDYNYTFHSGNYAHKVGTLDGIIVPIVFLLPLFAVDFRRIHDVNKSAWWLLIIFTIVGIIPLIYWMCSKGTKGDNRFGPDPLAVKQP